MTTIELIFCLLINGVSSYVLFCSVVGHLLYKEEWGRDLLLNISKFTDKEDGFMILAFVTFSFFMGWYPLAMAFSVMFFTHYISILLIDGRLQSEVVEL